MEKRIHASSRIPIKTKEESADSMSSESHRCQHCKLPLIIHESLEELSNAQSNLLTSQRNAVFESSTFLVGEEPNIASDRLSLLAKARSNNEEPILNIEAKDSYVLLPNDGNTIPNVGGSGRLTAISDTVNALDKINEILHSDSDNDIDYPICSFCAEALISQLKARLDQSVKEKQIYLQFSKKLTNQAVPNSKKSQEHLAEIEELKKHEQQLAKEHEAAEKENQELIRQVKSLEEENQSLAHEETKLWALRNQYELELNELTNEKDAINALRGSSEAQLEKLKRANVYNDVFKISHDGQFGTISGLRLGNLDSCRISWHEINAALGQLVLLLATLSNKLGLKIQNYTLKPLASFSKIEKQLRDPNGVAKVSVLECYSSGESSLQRLVNHYKFDSAMCAIVDILRQMEAHLHTIDDSIDLPYRMVDDKVGEFSVKLQSKVTSEEWTTACKCLLINTKWILAYSSAHHSQR